MIIIIDYGLGNHASVLNMVRKVGGKAKVSSEAKDLLNATKLILPGVGAFDHGIEQLQRLGLFKTIQELAHRDVPTLGICLGMQLLGNKSEEGCLSGLGLIDATLKKFAFNDEKALRVPHVGWNHVKVLKENPLIIKNDSEQRFYFTHSYYAICKNSSDVLATADYGAPFTAAYSKKNIFGVQFHPEKSHRFGMSLMKKFLDL